MLNVLIADDEMPIREWLSYCIEKEERFQLVGAACNGEEAYELALEKKPDLIITDICMPGMDGLMLLEQIKKVLPYIRFIILTNYAEFSYAKKAITNGASEYLLKSEMRSSELLSLLDEFEQKKENLLKNKKAHILEDGYIDLYEIYEKFEDLDYPIRFWKELLLEDAPYWLIGVEKKKQLSKQELLELCEEEAYPYLEAAVNFNTFYLIVQDTKTEIREKVEKTTRKLLKLFPCNVSYTRQNNLSDFLSGLEDSRLALLMHFFRPMKEIIFCNDWHGNLPVDFDTMQKKYKEVIDFLSYKKYKLAQEALKLWFQLFKKMNLEDLEGSVEFCKRMVFSLEERYFSLNLKNPSQITMNKTMDTMTACSEWCVEMLTAMENGSSCQNQIIAEALTYIHDNYNQNISLSEVANHIYRSPEYLSRLFKEQVGENFSVYLMLLRLNMAKKLLIETNRSVTDIAFEVGYSSHNYFSRCYKKYMGNTAEMERLQYKAKKSK